MADNDDGLRGRVRRAVSGAASTATRAASVAAGRSTSRGPAAPSDEGAAASTAAPATRPAPAKKAAPARKAAPAEPAAPARKAPAATKAAPAKKAPAKRATRRAAGAAPGTAEPGTVAGSTATGTESSTAQRQTAPTSGQPSVDPASLAVREDEDPWTPEELAEVRGLLEADAGRFEAEITDAEATVADMLSEGDNGGEDQADTGTKTFEREHEMSLMAGHREALAQTDRALSRLDDGSYGVCESCGLAIGKARLQAFPRATLCVACKQREERR